MNKKTYHRMTRRSPARGFKLFKQKYLTRQRFYALLASLKLVRRVHECYALPVPNELFNRVICSTDKSISLDRGFFSLSYLCEGRQQYDHLYYTGVFRRNKVLFTDHDRFHVEIRARVIAQCEEFEIHFDPFTKSRVTRKYPQYYTIERRDVRPDVPLDEFFTTHAETHTADFFNTRLRAVVTLKVHPSDIDLGIKECVDKAYNQIRSYIENNLTEINEKLTGIKNDGEFTTKDGKRLLINNICARCGHPVFESSVEGYTAQCLYCDEDLYRIEVRRVDPEAYKDIYEFSKSLLQNILSK